MTYPSIYLWSQFVHISPSDEIKTVSGRQKLKPVFKSYLEIAESYHVSDHRFGIYAQSYVYMEGFGVNINFYGELGTKYWFWQKSCVCCSRTAASVPDQTDPGFGFTRVESTPNPLLGILFFLYLKYTMCVTTFYKIDDALMKQYCILIFSISRHQIWRQLHMRSPPRRVVGAAARLTRRSAFCLCPSPSTKLLTQNTQAW